MRQAVRLKLSGLVLGMLGIITAMFLWPSTGAAQGVPEGFGLGPTTNVPNLAWAGEEIRLEKCLFLGDGITPDRVDMGRIRANFLVEDWSGTSSNPNLGPQIEPSTVKLFFTDNYGSPAFCAMGDAVSLYPGMARVELDVVDNTGQLGYDPASPVLKHQFLAGWMTLNQPTLSEMSSRSFASTAAAEAASELGDPTGSGQFTAGGQTGYLDVHVTGSMPMTGAWSSLVGASTVTLPNDWVTLAHALATDNDPTDVAPWNTWDTSGDSTPVGYEGHSPLNSCLPDPPQFAGAPAQPTTPDSYTSPLDNGDNCTGGGETGPFSTVFGLSSNAAIGPFDALDPADTLLPDGTLSSQDAPMPAAQINVSIAPNSGQAGDTSGVGDLVAADKTKTYSRDFLGNTDNPQVAHNLYAPFYDAYIPATARGPVSSGVDGGYGNNFPGFLTDSSGLYHFWDTFSLASNSSSPTSCLQIATNHDPQHGGTDYGTPSGDSTVAVYTDQNGEAQVQYDPGMGFYFDSLVHNGTAIQNADGGCDLQALYGVAGGLGTSSITATAQYPFKPTDFPAMRSAAVTKSVMSLWSKSLSYDPKGPGAANNNSRIVIAHAQDINGDPFTGEVVCWVANGEGMVQWSGTVNGMTVGGDPVSDPKGSSFGRVCGTTDSNGNAAVEVLNSDPTTVDVIADFVDEGILRDITVDYATPGSSGGTPPPTGGSTTPPTSGSTGGSTTQPAGSSGTTAPSASLVAQIAPALVSAATTSTSTSTKGSSKSRVALARFLTPAHGAHYALVRISSASRTVRVRLRLLEKTRHGTKVVTRVVTLATNRTIKLGMSRTVLRIEGVTIL